jgi:hypothetical protein
MGSFSNQIDGCSVAGKFEMKRIPTVFCRMYFGLFLGSYPPFLLRTLYRRGVCRTASIRDSREDVPCPGLPADPEKIVWEEVPVLRGKTVVVARGSRESLLSCIIQPL